MENETKHAAAIEAYFDEGARHAENATQYKFKAIAGAACALAVWHAAKLDKIAGVPKQADIFKKAQEHFASVSGDSKSYRKRFFDSALAIARGLFQDQAALDTFAAFTTPADGIQFMRSRVMNELNANGKRQTLQEMLRHYAPTKAEKAIEARALADGITYEQARDIIAEERAEEAKRNEPEEVQQAKAEKALENALSDAIAKDALHALNARSTLAAIFASFDAQGRAALLAYASEVCATLAADAAQADVENMPDAAPAPASAPVAKAS